MQHARVGRVYCRKSWCKCSREKENETELVSIQDGTVTEHPGHRFNFFRVIKAVQVELLFFIEFPEAINEEILKLRTVKWSKYLTDLNAENRHYHSYAEVEIRAF